MKKILFTLSLVVCALYVNAQQVEMFGHSYYKPILYNPALTGSTGYINAMVISRMQWTGFTNSPQLNAFNLDGNFKNKNIGLGLGLISDRKGITNKVAAKLAYSYRLKLSKEAELFFGISAGIINLSYDFSKVVVATENDLAIASNKLTQTTYDANAGFALRWKNLELGASSPQVIGNKLVYKSENSSATYQLERHYMGYLQYKFFLNEEKGISIIPNALTRVVSNTPLQYDGTVTFDWADLFWVGATYKSGYAVSANAGFCLKKRFYVGYSYDFIIGSIGSYAGMSHEIMLNYKFGKIKEEQAEDMVEMEVEEEIVPLEEEVIPVEEEVLDEIVLEEVAPEEEVAPLPDLNTLLLANIIKEIEAILDDPNATSAQILDLKMKISAFSHTTFEDASMRGVVEDFTSRLKLPGETSPDIIVKGTLVLEGSDQPVDYTMVSITLVDKENFETVGTYQANPKSGKFLLILRPVLTYQLIIENEGYEILIKDISFPEGLEDKEVIQEIRLKKE